MKSFLTSPSFENIQQGNAIKWIAGGVGLFLLLLLSFATFGRTTTAIEPHHPRGGGAVPFTLEDDPTIATVLKLLAKLSNDVEALKRVAETYGATSSTSMPPQANEQPSRAAFELPPVWESLNLQQFLQKFDRGCRNFDGMLFENVDFSGINLGRISFQDSTFKSCSFERTNIVNGQFNGATFSKVRFDRSNIESASFENTLLEECSFDRSRMGGERVSFKNARLRFTSFEEASLYFQPFPPFDSATIDHGNFAEFSAHKQGGSNAGVFYGSSIADMDLSSMGKDAEGVFDFEVAFCGAIRLTRISLVGLKLRFPFHHGDNRKVAWENCHGGSSRNLIMTISESDFRNVTIVPPNSHWSGHQPLLSMKEYLSQIAVLDDKTRF